MIWAVLALMVGLTVVYMARPRFPRREVSSAQFFKDLPPPRLARLKPGLAPPQVTRSYILQLLVFLCILAALYILSPLYWGESSQQLRVWILIDTSAGMGAGSVGKTRMDLARKELDILADHLEKEGADWSAAFKLSSFNLERQDLLTTSNIKTLAKKGQELEVSTLGGNLQLVRGLDDPKFEATHLLVISHRPPPDWLADEPLPVIWRMVGEPLTNVGITRIQAQRDPLTRSVQQVAVETTIYGPPPSQARLQVLDPQQKVVLEQELTEKAEQLFLIDTPERGIYELKLVVEDAYITDNQALIQTTGARALSVDWRLPDRRLMGALGWRDCERDCDLRVTHQLEDVEGETPTLVVIEGGDSQQPQEIKDFAETSPLLADLNLDAVETAVLASGNLPDDWVPVLRFMDNTTWVAWRTEPRAALLHATSLNGPGVAGRLNATFFFNALRWLIDGKEPQPLYTLTSPLQPQPQGTRLALHQGEGTTWREPYSQGRVSQLVPVQSKGEGKPVWPIFLFLACSFLFLERTLNAFGSGKWR